MVAIVWFVNVQDSWLDLPLTILGFVVFWPTAASTLLALGAAWTLLATGATRLSGSRGALAGRHDDVAVDWGDGVTVVDPLLGYGALSEERLPGGRRHRRVTVKGGGLTTDYDAVELDGWLPPLTLSAELTNLGGARDRLLVEDVDLLDRYDVVSYDGCQAAAAYAHAFLHPRMMELLLVQAPRDFWVRGRWVATKAADRFERDDVAAGEMLDPLGLVTAVADLVPSFLHQQYADDTELHERATKALAPPNFTDDWQV